MCRKYISRTIQFSLLDSKNYLKGGELNEEFKSEIDVVVSD